MKKLNQTGASHLVLVLAVVVIAAVGVVGYRVLNKDEATTETAATSQTSSSDNSDAIQSKSDVVEADKQLDSTSLDDVDPSQLDSDLNPIL